MKCDSVLNSTSENTVVRSSDSHVSSGFRSNESNHGLYVLSVCGLIDIVSLPPFGSECLFLSNGDQK